MIIHDNRLHFQIDIFKMNEIKKRIIVYCNIELRI